MAKAKKFELESSAPILDEEGEETLAAIDEAFGMRKLAEPSPQKKSASGCPSGLPPPNSSSRSVLLERVSHLNSEVLLAGV